MLEFFSVEVLVRIGLIVGVAIVLIQRILRLIQ
jgi:hypothetical protein